MNGNNAIWTNHASAAFGDDFIRVSFGDQSHPDIVPLPHSSIMMTNEVAEDLCRLIKESLVKQSEFKQQKYAASRSDAPI